MSATESRTARGERSRDEILDTAERLMSERGFAGTSMSALLKESGASSSSFYWFFPSKMDVLDAVMQRGAARFFAAVTVEPPTCDDPAERIREVLRRSARLVRERPHFLQLIFLTGTLDSDAARRQEKVVQQVRADGLRSLHENIEVAYQPWGEALAREIAGALAPAALAMFDGLFLASRIDGETGFDAVVETMVDAVHALAEVQRARANQRHPLPAQGAGAG